QMGGKDRLPITDAATMVAERVARARAAQAAFDGATQEEVDEVVTAVGWAIVDPEHNAALADTAVSDTGLGNVADKVAKNRRKTMGLLRDLANAKSVGVISEDPDQGLVEIARPVGVVGAITPSTNPAATPANNIINALKGRNAIILAPSPKGASTLSLLLSYVHAQLDRVGVARDLVQQLPAALAAAGGALLESAEAQALERAMFVDARPASAFVAQSASAIALRAGLSRPALLDAAFLIVEETGIGPSHPFSGEKLSPVLAF